MIDRSETDYLALQETRRQELRAELHPQLVGKRSITLEIGAGHGHFLAAYAARHPEQFCVGIDIMSDRVRRALRKRDRAKLHELTFVHASAVDFLAVLPESVSLAAIFVLFPDPWPKRRHWKNRLIQPEFLLELAQRSLPGAPFHFRTDFESYFEHAREVVAAHPAWQIQAEAVWPFEFKTVFQARAPAYQSLIASRAEVVAS